MELPPDPTFSPRFSLAGWNWKAYLSKNKAVLKGIVVALFAYLTWLATPIANPELKTAVVGVLTFAGKLIVDVGDYWLSDGPG